MRTRFHRATALASLCLASTLAPALAQPGAEAGWRADRACPAIQVEPERPPLADVRYLAADALEGRFSGTPGERCAGDYIAARFRELGLEPAGEDGFFQRLPLESAVNPHAPSGTGRNVIARLEGADPALRGQVVVLGAHYDHLGLGDLPALSTGGSGEIHNGADDNASGVAALLDAAERLVRGERPARSILFVAFTGEELGLIGSSYYASHPSVPLDSTVAMVNLDMVGRLGDDPLIVYGTGTAPEWEGILETANGTLEIPLAFEAAGYGPSDHTSFYAKDVPVLHLFTNVHGDYHRHTDDWEKIDAAGLARVGELTARIVAAAADRREGLTLVPGVGRPADRSEGYGAWLGTVPDFTPVDRGVLLSGVTAGSPAAEAGLAGGDVLIGLGEHEIGDLYEFTDALRAHRPGDEVIVRVLREGRELEMPVVLGTRAEREEP